VAREIAYFEISRRHACEELDRKPNIARRGTSTPLPLYGTPGADSSLAFDYRDD